MREPLMIVATGTKGVGKTYQTCQAIDSYIKDNPSTGKKGRKVLIYDVNMEYTDGSFKDNNVSFKAPILDIKDLRKWSRQERAEVRRIVPKDEKGNILSGDALVELLTLILNNFRGGLLVLEDINTYLMGTSIQEVVAVMCTNRHRDLDIYIHLQSIAAITPRMFQNAAYTRFHKQSDSLDRYLNRIPNPELYLIAEKLVNQKYIYDKRFYCFVQNQLMKITGRFSLLDYKKACFAYLLDNPKRISNKMKMFPRDKDARDKAISLLIKELLQYYGNPIKK
jgi:hypothetical protein